MYDCSIFTNENSLSYYLLGVICTDGSMHKTRKTVSLTSADFDWINDIKNIVCPHKSLYKVKTSKAYSLNINSKIIYEWFINKGVFPNKTFTLTVPSIPDEYIPDFIRGCIDGDGSIGLYKNRATDITHRTSIITLTSASEKFATEILKILNSKNIEVQLQIKSPQTSVLGDRLIVGKHKLYVLRLTSFNALNLINYLYYNNNVFSLKRKRNKADSIKHYFSTHKHKRIVEDPSKKVLIQMLLSKSINQIANDFCITQKVIYRWMKKYSILKRSEVTGSWFEYLKTIQEIN